MGDRRKEQGGTSLRAPFEGGARAREDRNQRRMKMHAAEGHAGTTPRDNPELDPWKMGERWGEFEELLGH